MSMNFIAPKLKALNFQVLNVYAEDWSYEITVAFPNVNLICQLWHYEEYPDGFLVMIHPAKLYVCKWFGKIDIRVEQQQLVNAVDRILRADQDIDQLQWWDEKSFNHHSW